jgi:hypothetical protein
MPGITRTFLLLLAFCSANPTSAQVWSKTSSPNNNWVAVASSADGRKLAAASFSGIYTSTNPGGTWALTSAPGKQWSALASSADGCVLLATATLGGIYTSTNSGSSWYSNAVPGNYSWDAAAASADGKTLIVGGITFAPVYYSTNMGVNWRSNGVPSGYYYSVVCSGDGTKLAADWGGTVYVSTNSGAAWTNYSVGGSSTLACSADGSHLFVYGSGMLVSTNWGATWQPGGQPNGGMLLSASADARRLIGLYSSSAYISTNFGVTWLSTYAPSQAWKSSALSADGAKLVASTGTGGIYVWQPPMLNLTNSAAGLVFSWPTNGTSFTLQSNLDLTSASWVAITNVPGVSNSLNQVILPPIGGNGFFRLVSQ